MLRSANRVPDLELLRIKLEFWRTNAGKNDVNLISRAIGKNNQEFVAADTDRYVARSDSLAKSARKFLKGRVTRCVPELVVNLLKVIQVQAP